MLIQLFESDISFDSCEFYNNTALIGGVLSINAETGNRLIFSHSHFHDNYASNFGGVMAAAGFSQVLYFP